MSNEALAKQLDDVLAELRVKVDGSRCTLRYDDEARGWHVNFPVAEATAPGVKSMRTDGSIDQRAGLTVKWMAANKRNLIQADLINNPDPAPPPALMSAYGAKAQMLGPLFNADGFLQGWISVHYLGGTRSFSDADVAALDVAKARVCKLLGLPS
jgi:maleate isomerase